MTEESNKDTQAQIGALKGQYESNKQGLLQRIITLVCDINSFSHYLFFLSFQNINPSSECIYINQLCIFIYLYRAIVCVFRTTFNIYKYVFFYCNQDISSSTYI
jgi:hypothetical protein